MASKVYIFGKQGCAKCETTKNKVGHYLNKWGMEKEVDVVFMDMDSPDGLGEGAFRDVTNIPTTIIEQSEREVARWDGEVPESDSLKSHLSHS